MRIVSFNLYNFEELSEASQEQAIEDTKMYSCNVDSESTDEEVKTVAINAGFWFYDNGNMYLGEDD